MKLRSILLLTAVVGTSVGVLVPARAADVRACDQANAFPKRSITKVNAGPAVYYIDDRQKTAGTPGLVAGDGTWTYLESNGKAGLQTGGIQAVFAAADDTEDADAIGEHDKSYCNENGTVNLGTSDTVVS